MLLTLLFSVPPINEAYDPDSILNYIRGSNAPYSAHGSSYFYQKYASTLLRHHPVERKVYREAKVLSAIPSEYDFRSKFPNCTSPHTIFDQGG
jgi:hypothetical protein